MSGLMSLLLPPSSSGIVATPEQESQTNALEQLFQGQIDVTGDRTKASKDYILEANRAPPTEDEIAEIVPREGLFGTKGTLRDILGTLGDAFLVQSGNNPMYGPRRREEKIGDAMYGFSQNPVQAIERLAAMGYPEQAAALQQQYSADQLRQAQIEQGNQRIAQGQARVDLSAEKQREAIRSDLMELSRGLLGDATEQNIDQILALIADTASKNGFTLEDLALGDGLTAEQARILNRADLTPYQRTQEEINQEKLELSRSETASRNANRRDQMRSRASRDRDSRTKASRSGAPSSSQAKRAADFYQQ